MKKKTMKKNIKKKENFGSILVLNDSPELIDKNDLFNHKLWDDTEDNNEETTNNNEFYVTLSLNPLTANRMLFFAYNTHLGLIDSNANVYEFPAHLNKSFYVKMFHMPTDPTIIDGYLMSFDFLIFFFCQGVFK